MSSSGVSVIVPVRDAADTIGALLTALRGQLDHALGTTEFIVVDNGSTDNTNAIVGRSGLTGLRLVSEERRGPSHARNRGMAAAVGDILTFIDADCVPTRRWLRELVEPFSDASVVIVAGSLASFPPKTPAQRFAARYGLNEAPRMVEQATMPFANTRNMAVRRSVAEAVGGFPVDMTQGEDVEFSFQVRRLFGATIEYRPAAVVFHQDRTTDEELWRQAYGYGYGLAVLYHRHPDVLLWNRANRLRRMRRTAQRRASSWASRMGSRLGRVDADRLEFATYLAQWDSHYWRGFADGRRTLAREGVTR